MANKQGVHAGANGPRFVFGRENLDYQGPTIEASFTPEMKNPSSDFVDGGELPYGSFGTLSDEEEKQRTTDLAGEFVMFALDDNAMSYDELTSMDRDEAEELMTEFVNSRRDTVGDDFKRLEQCYEDDFDLGVDAVRDVDQENDPHMFNEDYIRDNVDPGAKFPTATIGMYNDTKMFHEESLDNGFYGSFFDYLDSDVAQRNREEQREEDRENIVYLARDWHDRAKNKEGVSDYYCVIEGDGVGEDLLPDANLIAFPDLVEDPSWYIGQHEEDDFASQEWLQNKDGSLEVTMQSSDGNTQEFRITPLDPNRYYVNGYEELMPVPDNQDFRGMDSLDAGDIAKTHLDVGNYEQLADLLHKQTDETRQAFAEGMSEVGDDEGVTKTIGLYRSKYGDDPVFSGL